MDPISWPSGLVRTTRPPPPGSVAGHGRSGGGGGIDGLAARPMRCCIWTAVFWRVSVWEPLDADDKRLVPLARRRGRCRVDEVHAGTVGLRDRETGPCYVDSTMPTKTTS
ncbi:hypothetical protein IscW_ISCW009649 [Ixodes scapularis]|uniref:Uncharacterized protein n=1 Tax=Ixodes scapularis TaxID=6945 RepID=B7Q3A7_IXOSC|nr:hypothetical protein IscW_ISCW009649 [Ixodes scapularis]|eukprot:XP_002411205.1 hypothetical protein IscW_ISCW009649 [Ixodes scapularis]